LRRLLTPWRVAGAIAFLALIALLVLYSVPSGAFPGTKSQYILLPGGAHPVAPLVQVQGARPSKSGSLYFVDVFERRASTLEALFPSLHSHASLVPADAIVPPCTSEAQATAAALEDMALSHRVAAVVALRKLHYHVVARPTGVLVSQVILGTHAPCHLQEHDVVVAVDGTPTPTEAALHKALGQVEPGAVVELRYEGDEDTDTYFYGSVEERGIEYDIITPGSPLGEALVGKAVGDKVEYASPTGATLVVEVVAIR